MRTNAPMKKCVDALTQADGDIEEAATLLRKAGLTAALKKADRGANDGAAAVAHGPVGELLELAEREVRELRGAVLRRHVPDLRRMFSCTSRQSKFQILSFQ